MNSLKKTLAVLLALLIAIVSSFQMPFSVLADETDEDIHYIYEGTENAELKAYSDINSFVGDMTKVCEKDGLSLYVLPYTAEFAVKTSAGWYLSNPLNPLTDIADEDEQKAVASVLRITYFDENLEEHIMTSFGDAAQNGHIKIARIENGFAADIQMGDSVKDLLPEAAEQKSFEKNVLGKLGDFEKDQLLSYYKLVDKNDMDPGLFESYASEYPKLNDQPMYILRTVGEMEKETLNGYLASVGYTVEQLEIDRKNAGLDISTKQKPAFAFRMEVTIDKGNLCINLPMDKVTVAEGFLLQKINLLEFFNAARQDDNGYLFYPDGSGALLDFSKGNLVNGVTIDTPVYGDDSGVSYNAASALKKNILMPVFGSKVDSLAYLAVIEDGEAMASICANSGISATPYSNIWSSFNYVSVDDCEQTTGGTTYEYAMLDENYLKGNIKLRYLLLNGNDADYSGMARAYRSYLADNKILKERNSNNNQLPLYIATLGAVKSKKKLGIIPVTQTTVLTDFDDSMQICKELKEIGIKNLSLRLIGWANGGMDHSVFSKVKVERKLGSVKGLKKLQSFADNNGITVYPDVVINKTDVDKFFDGFMALTDAAHQIDGSYQLGKKVNLSANRTVDSGIMIKPKKMEKYFDSFAKKYKQITSGISLESIGCEIHSDFSNKNPYNRQQSLKCVQNILKKASGQYNLMVSGGNMYSAEYSDSIVELSSTSSSYIIQKASIPFVQMVLHGYVNYTGNAINLSGNDSQALLKAAENGEGLYFVVAKNNVDELLETDYASYYAVDYEVCKDKIISYYKQLSGVFGNIQNEQIVSHRFLNSNVTETVYSNGTKVYVNYSSNDYKLGKNIVPSENFIAINS